MQQEKLREISLNLSADRDDYMSAFRSNLFTYLNEKNITIKEISETSNVPFSTLNTLLYGTPKDCKLSTVIKLAHALDVSIDELIGAETIDHSTRIALAKTRLLSDNSKYLIQWFVGHQEALEKEYKRKKIINIMHPLCLSNGNLKPTNEFDTLDISMLDPDIASKVFIGIQLPCEHYMPTYTPLNILLIANDRKPLQTENSMIIIGGNLYIAKRKERDGIAKYFSIRDGKFRCNEEDVDEIIGYIAFVCDDIQYLFRKRD